MTHLETILIGNIVLAGIVYLLPMIMRSKKESRQWFIIEGTFYLAMIALPFLANMFNEAHGFGRDRVYTLAFMGIASTFVLMYRSWKPIHETQTKESQQQEETEAITSQDSNQTEEPQQQEDSVSVEAGDGV